MAPKPTPPPKPEAPAVEPEPVADTATYGTQAESDAPVEDVVDTTTYGTREPVERVVLSAGVSNDLEMQGWAGDPATGGMFRRDKETGEVTFEPRGGEPHTVEI